MTADVDMIVSACRSEGGGKLAKDDRGWVRRRMRQTTGNLSHSCTFSEVLNFGEQRRVLLSLRKLRESPRVSLIKAVYFPSFSVSSFSSHSQGLPARLRESHGYGRGTKHCLSYQYCTQVEIHAREVLRPFRYLNKSKFTC